MSLYKKKNLLDWAGLTLIGAFCVLYVLFYKFFAERHIQFPFLDFPIFVGEILLLICLIFFCTKYYKNLPELTKWHYLIIGYFIFVVLKALYGYITWGPLAFRHAALFYYPMFAIFTYAFSLRKKLDKRVMGGLAVLILGIFVYRKFYGYWVLTLTFLCFILIKSSSSLKFKVLTLVALCFVVPFREFFSTSRMMLVSNFISGIYVAAALPFIIQGKKKTKMVIAFIAAGMVFGGAVKFSNHKAVKSIFDFDRMSNVFSFYDKKVDSQRAEFEFKEIPKAQLYNPERSMEVSVVKREADPDDQIREKILSSEKTKAITKTYTDRIKEKVKQDVVSMVDGMGEDLKIGIFDEEKRRKINDIINLKVNEEMNALVAELASAQQNETDKKKAADESMRGQIFRTIKAEIARNYEDAEKEKKFMETRYYNDNAVFRLIIWRDMIRDFLKEGRFLFGVDFGKPFRSVTLEMLHWGEGDWSRDGWIGAHNSHLHIIYRAGLIGVLMIIAYVSLLIKMILQFIRQRSLTGILLCGIIINWFVAANFLLVLELPYTAIPIWTIYGLTFAYSRERLKDELEK